MYRANQRYHKHRAFMKFMAFVVPVLIIILLLVWWFFIRNSGLTSANFDKVGNITVEKTPTKEFTTPLFRLTLPATWKDNGRKNPFSYEVYYEYQNTQKDYDNRWLRVYVDVFPRDKPINRLMPVTIANNRIVTGVVSDDCITFTEASATVPKPTFVKSKWQGVEFVCDLANPQNVTGTASAEEGYALTLTGPSGVPHDYFFTYTDFNVRNDFQTLNEALKTFEPL